MKALRLALATVFVSGLLGLLPSASATECTDPKKPCSGGCKINREFSTEDLRPIICYS